jgi:hypothetical protein
MQSEVAGHHLATWTGGMSLGWGFLLGLVTLWIYKFCSVKDWFSVVFFGFWRGLLASSSGFFQPPQATRNPEELLPTVSWHSDFGSVGANPLAFLGIFFRFSIPDFFFSNGATSRFARVLVATTRYEFGAQWWNGLERSGAFEVFWGLGFWRVAIRRRVLVY